MANSLFSFATLGNSIVSYLVSVLGNVWYQVVVNAIGVIAIGLKITETQNKKRNKIIFFAMMNMICWIVYFILNGDFTSGIVNLIACIQTLVFYQRKKHKWANSIIWLFFFIAVQIALSVFIWKGPLSLFSICAGMLGTVTYFVMDERKYRYLFLVYILLWIGNGIAYFYPIALIHDSFAAISIFIAIIRYNILKKNNKQQKTEDTGKNNL